MKNSVDLKLHRQRFLVKDFVFSFGKKNPTRSRLSWKGPNKFKVDVYINIHGHYAE